MSGFFRAPQQPACRFHRLCTNIDPVHWEKFDHPSTHPFLCEELPMQLTPKHQSSKKRPLEVDTPCHKMGDKLNKSDTEPLQVGETITVSGSTGNRCVRAQDV